MAWFKEGQAPEVERIDSGAEADERVLDHLAQLGCDATTPCLSSHFVYLPDRTGADATAAALRGDGWKTTVVAGGEGTCLVVATQLGGLDSRGVRRTRKRLEALAAEHGGVYDGWQATAS